MLQEEFLKPMGITQKELLNSNQVPDQQFTEIINQKQEVIFWQL